MTDAVTHPLAHRGGIQLVLAFLHLTGSMCPKCGFGTRVTSKRWARCKKCSERVSRRTDAEAEAILKQAVARA